MINLLRFGIIKIKIKLKLALSIHLLRKVVLKIPILIILAKQNLFK